MRCMAKQNVTVRLDADRVAWADDYAAARRGWSRTTVFEAALDALRGDAAGGVPDRPARTTPKNPVDEPHRRPGPFGKEPPERELDWQEIEMARRRAKR